MYSIIKRVALVLLLGLLGFFVTPGVASAEGSGSTNCTACHNVSSPKPNATADATKYVNGSGNGYRISMSNEGSTFLLNDGASTSADGFWNPGNDVCTRIYFYEYGSGYRYVGTIVNRTWWYNGTDGNYRLQRIYCG